MDTLLQIVHWLAGFIVLAEALNKLERTAPCARGLSLHERIVDALKALAWAMLAIGAAGAVAVPVLRWVGMFYWPQDLAAQLVLIGFAVLVVRTRVKEG